MTDIIGSSFILNFYLYYHIYSQCIPKLLLADEPTGALDSKSGAQVMELFQRLNDEGVSVLMITHDADIAAHAKRVVTIKDGILQEKR